MALLDVKRPLDGATIPPDVQEFLDEADRRIDELHIPGRVTGFVPSDYAGAFTVLRAVAAAGLSRGPRFCEWGSGFGVVTCLAAMLDFEACGIEIEAELVEQARQLADDFGVPAEFAHGSFVPRGAERRVHASGTYAWLMTEGDYAYDDLGLDPRDMDLVFAYPWPDEEAVTGDLFDRYAGDGALLVTYHGGDEFRLRRKARRRGRR